MRMKNSVNLAFLILLSCFGGIGFCFLLPQDEVDALKQVAKTLGRPDWNFTVDPCDEKRFPWTIQNPVKGSESYVNCNCSSTVCHVIRIGFKSQNLQGTLPPELVRLPYLGEIDLTRNFLNGTIPPQWASLPLGNISLLGNRLTGPIPKEFGNITTLKNLTLEANWLSGPFPPELGNLTNLQKVQIGSNAFTGTLPKTFAKLKNLLNFRVSQTSLSGQIPDFIGNWTLLQRLEIQGTNMVGPIPSTLSSLTNLIEIRISDMNGSTNVFPDLSQMVNMKNLILRNCNISGELPDFLAQMTNLKVLDLSFNRLTGKIPKSFESLAKTKFIYLTSNSLSGIVPDWMLKKGKNIDLSFNNFTWLYTGSTSCQQGAVNLLGSSYITNSNSHEVVPCLTSSCHGKNYYLHINCGGEEEKINHTRYVQDDDPGNARRYFESSNGGNWAFSSTGDFMDNDLDNEIYITSNKSTLSMPDAELYMQARISPISLTYYGLCLGNGNYTVNLHFAEIIITNDDSFSSLGKRIFDVYIQGKLVRKDFNIKDEAQGSNKVVVKKFPARVEDNTLEIRLYWAGKGTTALPERGTYGPLISAIAVEPDFKPPGGKKIVAIAVGIVASVLFLIIMILGILRWKGYLGRETTMHEDLRGIDLQTGSFTLRQIKAATDNFSAANKIGEGGFGPVYKGLLSDGTIIAVKMLSSKSKQGNREFLNEIGMISAMQHPNLVKLYGCCIEGNQLLLVYEYLENNSLARALFGPKEYQLKLDWTTRYKICVGIARGLAYLHGESRLKIVHRDIKATNVLLDKELNPKISDFGLAKLDEEDESHISTRIAGTIGYMAPEYATRGYLTSKADVYSFGIVALEVVSGKRNSSWRAKEERFYLLDWAHVLRENNQLKELIDPRLGLELNEVEASRVINTALLCTSTSPIDRPTMSIALSMLEGRTEVPATISDPNLPSSHSNFDIISEQSGNDQLQTPDQSQSKSLLTNHSIPSFTNSSICGSDLYPFNPSSQYLSGKDH